MDTKTDKTNWEIIIDECCATIVTNFCYMAPIQGTRYACTLPPALQSCINNELKDLKSHTHNDIQLRMMSFFAPQKAEDIGCKLAGTLSTKPAGSSCAWGVSTTGLTRIYYDNLRQRLDSTNNTIDIYGIRDLKTLRQKEFLLSFSIALIQQANTADIKDLSRADNVQETKNLSRFMAKHRNNGMHFSPYGLTTSYKKYLCIYNELLFQRFLLIPLLYSYIKHHAVPANATPDNEMVLDNNLGALIVTQANMRGLLNLASTSRG